MVQSASEKAKTEEADWVTRAKAGDFDAFERLVNRHEKRLYGFAVNIVRNREDAEDVVQSTFTKALAHLKGFREEASFATWVTRIAGNTALKILKKRRKENISLDAATSENEEGLIPHPEYIADWREDPLKRMQQKEIKSILDKAIDALPENHRIVFMLRDVVGMRIAETAEALGISEANVKVRLLRARLALRESLTRHFGDADKRILKTLDHGSKPAEATSAQMLLRSYQK